jgi:poly-D-alanine transfer protein DltD
MSGSSGMSRPDMYKRRQSTRRHTFLLTSVGSRSLPEFYHSLPELASLEGLDIEKLSPRWFDPHHPARLPVGTYDMALLLWPQGVSRFRMVNLLSERQ